MSVEIQLTDQHWLVSHKYSWALAEKRLRTHEGTKAMETVQVAWYLTVGDAIDACLERELRQSDATTLGALQELARETSARLREATKVLSVV